MSGENLQRRSKLNTPSPVQPKPMVKSGSSGTVNSAMSGTTKRVLPPPTQFSDIVEAVFIHFATAHLALKFSTLRKALVLLGFVAFFAALAPFLGLPRNPYLASKSNFLNKWFVKWGWLWTLVVLGPFMWWTAQVLTLGTLRDALRHMARLIVAHLVWYFTVSIFVNVEHRTRGCTLKGSLYLNESACIGAGGQFASFDISGHCFLLIYTILIMTDEARVLLYWPRLKILLGRKASDPTELVNYSPEQCSNMEIIYNSNSLLIKVWFVLISVLCFLWEFMLMITVFYHHTYLQKVTGAAVAVIMWYVTYCLCYPLGLGPCSPGVSMIRWNQEYREAAGIPQADGGNAFKLFPGDPNGPKKRKERKIVLCVLS